MKVDILAFPGEDNVPDFTGAEVLINWENSNTMVAIEPFEDGNDLILDGEFVSRLIETAGIERAKEFLINAQEIAGNLGLHNLAVNAALDENDQMVKALLEFGFCKTAWRGMSIMPDKIIQFLGEVRKPIGYEVLIADESSLPEVSEIMAECLGPASNTGEAWTPETASQYLSHNLSSSDIFCVVVGSDGQTIGFAMADLSDAYLHIICVRPSDQNRKIGSYLILNLAEVAKRIGITELRFGGNIRLPSFDWYDKLGAKPIGTTDYLYKIGIST